MGNYTNNKMLTLNITNGMSLKLNGLGSKKPIQELSDKSIKTAVRKILSEYYKNTQEKIIVSCDTTLNGFVRNGRCSINNIEYSYTIE